MTTCKWSKTQAQATVETQTHQAQNGVTLKAAIKILYLYVYIFTTCKTLCNHAKKDKSTNKKVHNFFIISLFFYLKAAENPELKYLQRFRYNGHKRVFSATFYHFL